MKKLIGSKIRFSIGVTILFAILTISNSCTKDSTMYGMGSNNGGSGSPGANEVWIEGMAFTPSVITVASGTTITWTNKASIAHTVTSDKGLFDSGDIGSMGTFSFKFSTAGSYQYHCAIHPSMTAKVVVN
jgi:plastocyanin